MNALGRWTAIVFFVGGAAGGWVALGALAVYLVGQLP